MFDSLFENLKRRKANASAKQDTSADPAARRKHSRRDMDKCVAVIDGRTFPVVNWSLGGLQISGDERFFAENQTCDVTLKFRLSKSMIEVPHTGRVVRSSKGRVAFEFAPLTGAVRDSFQNVVDDYVMRRLGGGQVV